MAPGQDGGLYSEETEDQMFSHFGKEIEALKKEIKKVQSNIKSQNVRMRTLDKEVAELNKELEADKLYDDRSEAELQVELQTLNERIASLEATHSRQTAQNEQIKDDMEALKVQKQKIEDEITASRMKTENLKKLISKLKNKNESLQMEKKASEEVFRKLMDDLSTMTSKLSQLEDDLNMDVTSLQEKILGYKKTIDDEVKHKQRFLAMINRDVKSMNDLQRKAQNGSISIATTRLEFSAYCSEKELTSAEKVGKGSEDYAALKEEFNQYRQLMLEDRQQMLRETQELLLSVKHQFETYRSTAEEVLAAEMHNIDHHLNMHKRLCDLEIKIYKKESNFLFEDMVSSKNAKIMDLLQGSAYHAQYFRHQEELQALAREHARELEAARIKAKEEVEKERLQPLRKRISKNDEEIARHKKDLDQCEREMQEALEIYNRAGEKLAEMELKHSRQIRGIEEEADRLRTDNARIQIEIQRLRHEIMREKLGSGALQLDRELAKEAEAEAKKAKEEAAKKAGGGARRPRRVSTISEVMEEGEAMSPTKTHMTKSDLISVVNRVSDKVLDLRSELGPMLSEVEGLEEENSRLEAAKKAAERRLRMWEAKVRQEREALQMGLSGLEGILQRLTRNAGYDGKVEDRVSRQAGDMSQYGSFRSTGGGKKRTGTALTHRTARSGSGEELPEGEVEAMTSYLMGGITATTGHFQALQRAHRRLMEADLARLAGLDKAHQKRKAVIEWEGQKVAVQQPTSARGAGGGRKSPRLQWMQESGSKEGKRASVSARGAHPPPIFVTDERGTASSPRSKPSEGKSLNATTSSIPTPLPSSDGNRSAHSNFSTPTESFYSSEEEEVGGIDVLLKQGEARLKQFKAASSQARAGLWGRGGKERVAVDPLLSKGVPLLNPNVAWGSATGSPASSRRSSSTSSQAGAVPAAFDTVKSFKMTSSTARGSSRRPPLKKT
mmetsp:Transcript_18350/g.45996  ORF Transcript_18350/g.45996 Transcript_18350/m.45996 type:complete len:954 (-) Transcript_18350:192-3053(-)